MSRASGFRASSTGWWFSTIQTNPSDPPNCGMIRVPKHSVRRLLKPREGSEVYRSEIGNSLPPGFTASKILWVRDNEPDAYLRIRSILLPHDFLNFYLTGEKTAEAGDASGTGYFDVRNRRWSDTVLGAIDPEKDLGSCLPRLISSNEAAGLLRTDSGQESGEWRRTSL